MHTQIETAHDVIIDLLEDTKRRLHRFMETLDPACLDWSPDGAANSIAVTVWHMGRLMDVFFHQQMNGQPAEAEVWFTDGWAKRTAYDPRGIGRDGWGSINGYTAEEVAAIPPMDTATLLGYFDAVHATVVAYLPATPLTELNATAPGFEGKFTRYQVLQMAFMDHGRHLGELYAIKNMWEHHNRTVAD